MVKHLHAGISPVLTPELRTRLSIIVVVGLSGLSGFSECLNLSHSLQKG